MELRLGASMLGETVSFDSSTPQTFLVLGDAGAGKTTLARYVTRWWLADTARHAHVFASMPWEWSGIRAPINDLKGPWLVAATCRPNLCLTVLDGLAHVNTNVLNLTHRGLTRVLVTATAAGDLGPEVTSVGLIPAGASNSVDLSVMGGQSRLDWPPDTVPLIPVERGSQDLPRHRWQAVEHSRERVRAL